MYIHPQTVRFPGLGDSLFRPAGAILYLTGRGHIFPGGIPSGLLVALGAGHFHENAAVNISITPTKMNVNSQKSTKLCKGAITMENEREERTALIAAILPLLEKMPLKWLRATYITVRKRASRE